eukprot:CAMPEP_0113851444 /NCGR_PEP_ID=MMETSP0372-20130328/4653_1 /TAXON_ID=340204 /ORGANISM="Lankesteria abbotti" /LENGTH=173 /DNA_ID=CAMNT_0000822273 /DNA_START=356 /DNA_END=877 /DNA_ORIENTATION=+ /assembly_acc=CAM_ASM_000359
MLNAAEEILKRRAADSSNDFEGTQPITDTEKSEATKSFDGPLVEPMASGTTPPNAEVDGIGSVTRALAGEAAKTNRAASGWLSTSFCVALSTDWSSGKFREIAPHNNGAIAETPEETPGEKHIKERHEQDEEVRAKRTEDQGEAVSKLTGQPPHSNAKDADKIHGLNSPSTTI